MNQMVDFATLGLGFVINVIVGAIVLHIAAMIAKVDDATIMKALTAAVIAAIIGLVLGMVSGWGGLLTLIIAIVVIKYVYNVEWGKAIFVWIIYLVLSIIIGLILGALGLAVFMAM